MLCRIVWLMQLLLISWDLKMKLGKCLLYGTNHFLHLCRGQFHHFMLIFVHISVFLKDISNSIMIDTTLTREMKLQQWSWMFYWIVGKKFGYRETMLIVRYSGSGVAEGPLATTGYTVVEQFVIAAAIVAIIADITTSHSQWYISVISKYSKKSLKI